MREDLHTELKREWKDEYLRNVAALANTEGGTIYVGVDDHGDIYGVDRVDHYLKAIPDKIQNVLGIVAIVDNHVKDGKDYLTIKVSPCPDTVLLGGRLYVKSGSTTRELRGAEMRNFLTTRGDLAWADESVDVDPEQLDTYAFRAFKKAAVSMGRLTQEESELPMADLLGKLNLMRNGKPTRAAMILFSPDAEEVSAAAGIRICKEINGDIEFFDEIYGPMFLSVDRALDLIMTKYTVTPITYEGIIRVENYPYPKDAIREALINAISNADYGCTYPIKISVLPDRLIIQNPGSLPYGYTVEQIIKGRVSKPRNRGIAMVLRTAGMSEAFGRGFEKMSLPYKEQGVALPEYEALPQDFLAIFTNIVVAKGIVSRDMNGKEVTSGGGNEIPEGLTDKERLILDIISKGEFDAIRGVSERLSISHGAVERVMKSLVSKKLIERRGSDKSGSWVRI